MRHEFMSNMNSQDELGRLGCYKFFKNSVLVNIGEDYVDSVEGQLQEAAQSKINLHKADVAFGKTLQANDEGSAAFNYALERLNEKNGHESSELSRLGYEDRQKTIRNAHEAVDFMLANKNQEEFCTWFVSTWSCVPVRKEFLNYTLEILSQENEDIRDDYLHIIALVLKNAGELGEDRVESFIGDLQALQKEEFFEYLL